MDAASFARDWEAGWNSHNLDRILSHYHEDIVFRSRKAIPITGSGLIRGKAALCNYWAAALRQQPELHFRVQDVFSGFEMVVISYQNHRDVLAAETLHFDQNGMVTQASACHRA